MLLTLSVGQQNHFYIPVAAGHELCVADSRQCFLLNHTRLSLSTHQILYLLLSLSDFSEEIVFYLFSVNNEVCER
jgi:hypothetical protein